jgi:hypothetical protein
VKKSSQKICATSVIAKTLPNVNNCPMGGNFAQSGRPECGPPSSGCSDLIPTHLSRYLFRPGFGYSAATKKTREIGPVFAGGDSG